MKNEQGFSLVELLIVVAIIAIIAAIAVPSLLTSRMAANESGGIQGCRTIGSAEVAFASTNNASYATMAELVAGSFLDARFTNATGFNGYTYVQEDQAINGSPAPSFVVPDGFGLFADPKQGQSRYQYGIAVDQVVYYQSAPFGDADPKGLAAGSPIGKQ